MVERKSVLRLTAAFTIAIAAKTGTLTIYESDKQQRRRIRPQSSSDRVSLGLRTDDDVGSSPPEI